MKPTKNRVHCPGCGRSKMLFATLKKADNFIKYNSVEISTHSNNVPARSYYCTFCLGWHVTSIADEETAKKCEEHDKALWEEIKASNKITAVLESLENSNGFHNLPFNSKGLHIQRLIDDLDSKCTDILRMLAISDFSSALESLEEAMRIYEYALNKCELYRIRTGEVRRRESRIRKLKEDLSFLMQMKK